MKPIGCVYPKCFDCPLPDCTYNGNYTKESKIAKQTEWRKNNPDKVREIQHRYIHSEKGKLARERYANSEKNKLYQKEYQSREDVKQKKRIYAKEMYEKRKEYFKNYRLKKKLERLNA